MSTATGGIRFGASGWHGIIAEDFTFTAVRAVAQAIAEHVRTLGVGAGDRGVVIGYDTRFLSEAFAAQIARVLAAQGVRAFLCARDTPTAAVVNEVLKREASGGIVVTAGRARPEYNGIKFFAAWGGPATPEAIRQIEDRANTVMAGPRVRELSMAEAERRGLIQRIDPWDGYLDRLRTLVNFETIREAHLRVVVDALWGSGQGYLDAILRETGCTVTTMHAWRDPGFGGHSPDPTGEQLQELSFQVVENRGHLGLATDGDGDHFGVVDADGSFLEPNCFLGLVLAHLVRVRGWTGGVARSIATGHFVDAVARHLEIPVYETPVGFRYIGELIARDAVVLGGEEDAGLTVKGHVPEADGILACLLAAELVAYRRGARLKTLLQELYAEVGTYLTKRREYALDPGMMDRLQDKLQDPPGSLAGLAVIEVKRQDGVKMILEDGSWLFLRSSGMSPEVRLYVEASTPERVERLVAAGEALLAV